MSVRVGPVAQLPDGVIIGDHKAGESPFVPQHIAQQPAARVRRHPVNFVITRHDADATRFLQAILERLQKHLSQQAQRHIRRGAIHSRLRLAVRGKMFQRGNDVFFVLEGCIPLKPADRRHAQLCHEKRILAKRLLNPPPAWVAGNIHNRCQRLMRTAHTRFLGRHGV